MDSGKNNLHERTTLPAQSSSSLLALGNSISLVSDVLEKGNSEYWLNKAIQLLEKKWERTKNLAGEELRYEYSNPLYFAEALYNINRCLIIDSEFLDAYLLKGYVEVYLSQVEIGCDSIIESFCRNYIKNIVKGLYGLPNWAIENQQLFCYPKCIANKEYQILVRLNALRLESLLIKENIILTTPPEKVVLSRVILLLNFMRKRSKYAHEIKYNATKIITLCKEASKTYNSDSLKWHYLIIGICSQYLLVVNSIKFTEKEDPLKWFELALEIDSSFNPALFEKSRHLVFTNKKDEAKKIIEQVIRSNPNIDGLVLYCNKLLGT